MNDQEKYMPQFEQESDLRFSGLIVISVGLESLSAGKNFSYYFAPSLGTKSAVDSE